MIHLLDSKVKKYIIVDKPPTKKNLSFKIMDLFIKCGLYLLKYCIIK